MAYRDRAESWDDPKAPMSTEADLSAKFNEAHKFISSDVSVMQAVTRDWGTFNAYASGKLRGWRKQASGIESASDVGHLLAKPIPLIKTLRNYKLAYFEPDAAAGLVEGIMKIPSGLAFALLCNMPAQYGLYTSLLPPFIYMILGTCSQISFGVTAIEALFLGESVEGVLGSELIEEATADEPVPEAVDLVVRYTLFFTFLAGLWQLVFKFLHLGWFSKLLSEPVMSGFSTGGAFIIATSQLSGFLGVSLSRSECLPIVWKEAIELAGKWNWVSIGIGSAGLVLLCALQWLNKKYMPKFPMPWQIVIVIISIVVASQMNLEEEEGLKVVGDIPSGFPSAGFPTMPTIPGKSRSELLADSILPSFIIALFVYVMSLSLGTFFSGKNGYRVDAQQELLAIGMGNTLAPLCGSFMCSASFSRTAVVNTLGAKTVLHNVTALLVLILCVTLATGLLHDLPRSTLAIVVFNALAPMLEFRKGSRYFVTSKLDFLVWFLTFIVCLLAGAMYGIYCGVGLALLIILYRSAVAKVIVLGRLPGTAVYRDLRRFPSAKEADGVKIVRFTGGLNFVNYQTLASQLNTLVTKDVHTVVLDASAIVSIDGSALHGILELLENLETKKIKLVLANWLGPQRDMLERSGFYSVVPSDTIFLNLHDAVLFAKLRRNKLLETDGKDPATVTEAGGHVWRVGFNDPTS